jgi:hypothetical protein
MEQRCVTSVIFESDFKSVADGNQHLFVGVFEFSSLIFKVKSALSFHSNFMVKFIKRQSNIVADTFVRVVIS